MCEWVGKGYFAAFAITLVLLLLLGISAYISLLIAFGMAAGVATLLAESRQTLEPDTEPDLAEATSHSPA